ncbi:putative uncharacterized protein [Firmicutes bacterium CAG:822]|nr:putative uncharacterized protein [Firmicutes bacterium CAG:822]
MIKVIAFDLVGVLVTEKDIDLPTEEDKLERMFGDNISDDEYIKSASKIIDNEQNIINITKEIINKLYAVKDKDLFKKIKEKNNDIKIVIATNHVSFVKDFIYKHFDKTYIDDIFISAEIHKVKPNADFYKVILDKYNIKPNELLFVDDSQTNIDGAKALKINTIKIEKDSNVSYEIINYLKNK